MKRFLSLILLVILILPASAEITATVYPGYQFSANERPTTGNLNLLGRPTILVSGTLGGTNVALAANSVTTTMMSDTLPGTNLLWDGSSPRKLVIADSGVGTNQISTNIAGLGLGGGGGAPLSNKLDNAFLIITNDVVTISLSNFTNLISILSTNIARYWTTNYPATNSFTSYEYPIATGLIINTNHGLGATPRDWRMVVVCKTADTSGYAVGDEVDARMLDKNAEFDTIIGGGANATNVFASCVSVTTLLINNKTNGAEAAFTEANWKLKIYARP